MEALYILPFDHRGSFMKLFGITESSLTRETVTQLADYKHLIYEAFLKALEMGVPKNAAAIIVDEQFGARIQEEARTLGIPHILTVEKTGQPEFDFEYGDAFREHIEKFKPNYVKALVHYNPDEDRTVHERRGARLKLLSDFCREKSYPFLFELLAAPTEAALKVAGDKDAYETAVRWKVMIDAIRAFHAQNVEPDIWKLEGLEDPEQMRAVVAATREGGRNHIGVVILGRDESEEKVRVWLTVAAKIPGVVGFAVGRTIFENPLLDFHHKRISREETALRIAKKYKEFVDIFEAAKNGAVL